MAIDKKKINRAVRRERKEAEAEAAGGAAVGDVAPEFNAEARRKLAAASFYLSGSGSSSKRGKKGGNKKHRDLPTDDFGEAGWVGGQEQGKPKKNGKPKAAVPTYNTAGQQPATSQRLARKACGRECVALRADVCAVLALVSRAPLSQRSCTRPSLRSSSVFLRPARARRPHSRRWVTSWPPSPSSRGTNDTRSASTRRQRLARRSRIDLRCTQAH